MFKSKSNNYILLNTKKNNKQNYRYNKNKINKNSNSLNKNKSYLNYFKNAYLKKCLRKANYEKKANIIFSKINQNLKYKNLFLKKIKNKKNFFYYYDKLIKIRKFIKSKNIKLRNQLNLVTPKYFKRLEDISFKERLSKFKTKNVNINILYNRVIFFSKIYDKYNKKYYYYNNKLKKLKKKEKKIPFNIYL